MANKFILINLTAFIPFLGFTFPVSAQNYLGTFSQNQVDQANTADGIAYLNKAEQDVVLWINLVRLFPRQFEENVLIPYAKGHGSKPSYVRSLRKTLQEPEPLPLLNTAKDLTNAAREHAKKMGRTGKTGHANYKTRMKALQESYSTLSENCDYGNSDPLDILMSLLIDEDIPSLGHRKAILNPKFLYIGIAIEPHKEYQVNCVQEFGGKRF